MTLFPPPQLPDVVFCRPEIPQNTGTLIRTAAGLGFHLHLIEPLGFLMTDKFLKRSHMDYKDPSLFTIHACFDDFLNQHQRADGLPIKTPRRLFGLTPEAPTAFYDADVTANDFLLIGSEGPGLSDAEKQSCHQLISIPMLPGKRSLNVALSAALVLGGFLQRKAS